MLNEKWLIGIATAFILISAILNIMEYNDPIGSPIPLEVEEDLVCTSATCYLMIAIDNIQQVAGGNYLGLPTAASSLTVAIGHMLIWDYSFLKQPGWEIVRWGFFMPISLGLIISFSFVIISLLIQLSQAAGSAIGSLGGVFGGVVRFLKR